MGGRGQTRDSASSAGTERRLSFRIATPAYAAGQPAAVESGDDLPTRTIMQPTTPLNSPIPVPEIDSDEPVAVIPTASVAPLDGPPGGERINLFTLAPREPSWASRAANGDALGAVRERVLEKPLTCLATAFAFGLLMARVLR